MDAPQDHQGSRGLQLTLPHILPCPFREPCAIEPGPPSPAQLSGTKEKPQDPLEYLPASFPGAWPPGMCQIWLEDLFFKRDWAGFAERDGIIQDFFEEAKNPFCPHLPLPLLES